MSPAEQAEEETPFEEVLAQVIRGKLTSLMLRNIPNKSTAEEVMGLVGELGFAGKYDFFLVPIDNKSGKSRGYAFINFTSHSAARAFCITAHGYPFERTNRKAWVSMANAQGVLANLQLLRPWKKPQKHYWADRFPESHGRPFVRMQGTMKPISKKAEMEMAVRTYQQMRGRGV